MTVLYIGAYTSGCTSEMRGRQIKDILKPVKFDVIDTAGPFLSFSPLLRSIGWRYKVGPFINSFNKYLKKSCTASYDLIWIDKGIFINEEVIEFLRRKAAILVHYTPDTAFVHNKSSLFNRSVSYYDYCITTKSFEMDSYKHCGANNVIYCTQGFDKNLHFPLHDFSEKKGVCFVGQYEPYRASIIQSLVDAGIHTSIAGAKWENFSKSNRNNKYFEYLGRGLFSKEYVSLISGSLIGLGLLSKNFPELHTTRTFEIPACGTALATEFNAEINRFFNEDEVLFFLNKEDLVEKIGRFFANLEGLHTLSVKGYKKLLKGRYDYESILKGVFKQIGIK